MSVFWVILVRIFPAFSHIWTEYEEIRRISPYSVRMRENAGKKRTKVTPNTDTFYTVIYFWYNQSGIHTLVLLHNIHIQTYAGLLNIWIVLILRIATISFSNIFVLQSMVLMSIWSSLFCCLPVLRQLMSLMFSIVLPHTALFINL